MDYFNGKLSGVYGAVGFLTLCLLIYQYRKEPNNPDEGSDSDSGPGAGPGVRSRAKTETQPDPTPDEDSFRILPRSDS